MSDTVTKTIEIHNQVRSIELEAFLADALAYMRFCARKNISLNEQLITLAHDIGGLHRQERCFRPRVSGYAKHA